jgi:hypothetical protein
MVSAAQRKRVLDYIDIGVREGATIAAQAPLPDDPEREVGLINRRAPTDVPGRARSALCPLARQAVDRPEWAAQAGGGQLWPGLCRTTPSALQAYDAVGAWPSSARA